MIYTTGSIAVSGNTLTGTGTNFTAAGSLIRVGCTLISLTAPPQVFQITAIGSATQLTVTPAANPAIAAGTSYAILLSDSLSVDGLAQDIAETLTLYQRNISGFADVMNGSGDVTITINGVTVTVPGQQSLAKKGANGDITSLSGLTTALSIEQGGTGAKDANSARSGLQAAKSGANSDITSLSGLTTALSIGQGGTGTNSPFGSAANTFCQGNDPRLGTVNGKSGGEISSAASCVGTITATAKSSSDPANGTLVSSSTLRTSYQVSGVERVVAGLQAKYSWGQATSYAELSVATLTQSGQFGSGATYNFNGNGSATAPGSWVNNSDERIKTNIQRITDPLDKMTQLRGVSWDRLDGYAGGIGFIAQDVQKVFPGSVYVGPDRTLTDGTVIEGVLGVDTSGVAAALHHEAILALMSRIDDLEKRLKTLQAGS